MIFSSINLIQLAHMHTKSIDLDQASMWTQSFQSSWMPNPFIGVLKSGPGDSIFNPLIKVVYVDSHSLPIDAPQETDAF